MVQYIGWLPFCSIKFLPCAFSVWWNQNLLHIWALFWLPQEFKRDLYTLQLRMVSSEWPGKQNCLCICAKPNRELQLNSRVCYGWTMNYFLLKFGVKDYLSLQVLCYLLNSQVLGGFWLIQEAIIAWSQQDFFEVLLSPLTQSKWKKTSLNKSITCPKKASSPLWCFSYS